MAVQIHPSRVIEELCTLQPLELDLPVPKVGGRRSMSDLAEKVDSWFKENRRDAEVLIDFDECSTTKTGYKLLGIEVCPESTKTRSRMAEAVFSEHCRAEFVLIYDSKERLCRIDKAFRTGLPAWIKIGDPEMWVSPEKGIPTAKVLQILLSKGLGLNHSNVQTIHLLSVSAQTSIDLVHSVVIEGQSIPDAFSRCASAQLAEDLGEMLGGAQTRLVGVEKKLQSCRSIGGFIFTDEERNPFKRQKKTQDIIDQTGFDFRTEEQECYPVGFSMKFTLCSPVAQAGALFPAGRL